MFPVPRDVWPLVFSTISKASAVSFSLSNRESRMIMVSLDIPVRISAFEIGQSGSVDLVEWAHHHGVFDACLLEPCTSVHDENPHCLELEAEGLRISRESRLKNISCVASGAASVGAIHVLKYLRKHRICPHDPFQLTSAAQGDVETLEWSKKVRNDRAYIPILRLLAALKNKPAILKRFPGKDNAFIANAAAEKGHVEILEQIGKFDVLAIGLRAAEGGRLPVLQWMARKGYLPNPRCPWSFIATKAAKFGKTSVLDWISTDCGVALSREHIGIAGRHGQLDTARWLVDHLGVNEEVQ